MSHPDDRLTETWARRDIYQAVANDNMKPAMAPDPAGLPLGMKLEDIVSVIHGRDRVHIDLYALQD